MNNNFMKINLFVLGAALTIGMSLTSCAQDDMLEKNKTEEKEHKNEHLTSFTGGAVMTRTSITYPKVFKWTSGDKIWVEDDNGVWQQSTNAIGGGTDMFDPIQEKESFTFQVPGQYKKKSSYRVLYLGKEGTDKKITFASTQQQMKPNSGLDVGKYGDWGMATTSKTSDGNFKFTLQHKAAILCFMPFNGKTELSSTRISKIELTSDGNIAGTYTLNTTTNQLEDDAVSKTITLNSNSFGGGLLSPSEYRDGFPLSNTTADMATNGSFVVIKPGAHKLTAKFYLEDTGTGTKGVVTKDYGTFTYKENTTYNMKVDMEIPNFDQNYYMWDAKQNYWYPHQTGGTAPIWQPWKNGSTSVGTVNGPESYNANYPKSDDADRYCNASFPGYGVRNDAQTELFKKLPNANEMAWYVFKGDPHGDKNQLFSLLGHLYKGGMWILKSQYITGMNKETAPSELAPVTDLRVAVEEEYAQNTHIPETPPAKADLHKYFFLPELGWYERGICMNVGYNGYYWSSSAFAKNSVDGKNASYAFNLFFRRDPTFGYVIYVEASNRELGFKAVPFE